MYTYMYTYKYMNITTYIRKEDEDKWKSIPNKAEWLHNALAGVTVNTYSLKNISAEDKAEDSIALSSDPDRRYQPIVEEAPKLKVLDNDALKALLGGSGKQPITSEPTHVCKDNCKHWVWDSNSGKYINSLTGETRDAPEF